MPRSGLSSCAALGDFSPIPIIALVSLSYQWVMIHSSESIIIALRPSLTRGFPFILAHIIMIPTHRSPSFPIPVEFCVRWSIRPSICISGMSIPSAIRLSICVPVDSVGAILILLDSYGVLIDILISFVALFRATIHDCWSFEFTPTLLILVLLIPPPSISREFRFWLGH